MASELGGLMSSRGEGVSSACGIKGLVDRVNALVMVFRDVLRESSVCYVDGVLSFYDGRSYVGVGEDEVMRCLRNLAVGMGVSPTDLRQVGRMPLDVLGEDGKHLSGNPRYVSFLNCVLDLRERRPLPFSRDLVVSASLPYAYDRGATCGLFLSFLEEVLPDEGKRMALQEFFGLCLADRGAISVEKFALFIGEGANGKSVVCNVMMRVFGLSHVAFLDPSQLTDSKMLPDLNGKWLNISNDTRQDAAFDSALKALSSGQIVMARRNYHEPEQVVAPPLVFAMNALPRFADKSRGFKRRVLPIVFDVTIPEARQDRTLAQRICETDLCGIFLWCLDGRDRLLGNGGSFTASKTMEDDLADIMRVAKVASSHPVMDWLDCQGYATEPQYHGQEPERVSAKAIFMGLRGAVTYHAISSELRACGIEGRRSNTTYYMLYQKEGQ